MTVWKKDGTTRLISLHWLRVTERISFKLAVMTHQSIHGTSLSYLQSCFTRVADDIQTTAAVFYLTSSGSSAGSSLYSRQAGVSGFGCHRLERPASPRNICAVTSGFQTTTQDLFVFPFLPRHYHMTHVNTITIHHCWSTLCCLYTCGPWNNELYLSRIKMFMMMMMTKAVEQQQRTHQLTKHLQCLDIWSVKYTEGIRSSNRRQSLRGIENPTVVTLHLLHVTKKQPSFHENKTQAPPGIVPVCNGTQWPTA